MRIESIGGRFALAGAVLVAFASALIVEFQAWENTAWFRVLKNCGILASLVGWLFTWQKMKPFDIVIAPSAWLETEDRLGWKPIVISEKQHRRGKNPRVTFMRFDDRSSFMPPVETTVEGNGDVIIKRSRYSNIGRPEDFIVRISA